LNIEGELSRNAACAAAISASNWAAPPWLQQPLLPQSEFAESVQLSVVGLGVGVGVGVGVGAGVGVAEGAAPVGAPGSFWSEQAPTTSAKLIKTRLLLIIDNLEGRDIPGE
jgi:hypothetical protein